MRSRIVALCCLVSVGLALASSVARAQSGGECWRRSMSSSSGWSRCSDDAGTRIDRAMQRARQAESRAEMRTSEIAARMRSQARMIKAREKERARADRQRFRQESREMNRRFRSMRW
jgi:hypothetical protein